MRPFYKLYSPAAEDTDGYVNDATGATSPLTLLASSAGDGLAHKLNFSSSANLSGITLTIVGTDADGIALTESRAGPNNNTVETTGYFKTVTSIAISATLGANTMDAGWSDEFVTPTIRLDSYSDLCTGRIVVSGTINYTVQKTLSDIRTRAEVGPFDWSDVEDPAGLIDLSSVTATKDWVFDPPPQAMRIKANSYSASATLGLYLLHRQQAS